MNGAFDVVVVGAGIVGAACAEALAGEGLSVVVIERRGIAGGTTSAGMGHLVVMDDSEAQFALTRHSVELWQKLKEELPKEVEFDPCGTLWVAADEEEMAEVRRKHEVYRRGGVESEILDAKQVAEAEPNLRAGLAGGLRVAGDSVVYPPTAARWLLERAKGRAARVMEGEVIGLRGGEVRLADGRRLAARYVVNAAGVDAARLTAGINLRPRKGHLVITERYPGFVRHQLIELGYLKSAHAIAADSVAFNIQPRKTGQLLIGSSRQYGDESLGIDQGILQRMLARAMEYMPRLAGLMATRAWTGLRPSTPDKLPLIGPMPEDARLLLACGHEGLGITTSLGTARLIADHVMGRKPAIAAEAYLPGRLVKEAAHG